MKGFTGASLIRPGIHWEGRATASSGGHWPPAGKNGQFLVRWMPLSEDGNFNFWNEFFNSLRNSNIRWINRSRFGQKGVELEGGGCFNFIELKLPSVGRRGFLSVSERL